MAETYQPLYLKYRPQSLSDLVGQNSVAQTLTNAIEHDRITHAYLFTGPRGCGKTSSARILAKSLNCEANEGPTAAPCLQCASCMEIKVGTSPSVFELDAASNNSVDDARSLIERAPLVAQGGRYKLYIIDECHMLTKEAFNALLKTIEEPPPKVVFILATTEEHKVPPTIISRCQRLMFKLVNQKDLTAHLRHISTLEEINIADEALELIARRSGGGLRDALGLLDQASLLSSKDKPVGVSDLLVLLGAVHEDVLFEISEAIQKRDGHAVLTAANTLLMEGREPAVLVLELAKHFLNLTKASYINQTGGISAESLTSLVLGSPAYLQAVAEQAKFFDRAELALMVEYLDKLEQTCRRASQPVLSVEMGLLALCHRHDMTFVKDLDERLKAVEGMLSDSPPPATISQRPQPAVPAAAPARSAPSAPSLPPPPQIGAQSRPSTPTSRPDTPAAPQPYSTQHRDAAPTKAQPAIAPPRPDVPAIKSAPAAVSPAAKTAPDAGAGQGKPATPSSSVASKINAAMAAAGLGAPSTAGFRSGSGSGTSGSGAAAGSGTGNGGGSAAKPGGFPAHVSKVPLEAPTGDMSYDDVEPDTAIHKASPVVQPPATEPTLRELESQPDVVEEIDEYDILPKPTPKPMQSVEDTDLDLPVDAPRDNPPESEDEAEEEKPAEPPIASADEDDYNESELDSGFSAASNVVSIQASVPAAASNSNSTNPSTPGTGGGDSGIDIDEFWSDVKEALQKRHLPTFSIVGVHAFPVSFDKNDFTVGVRNETFQKQLDNKIEHLKGAATAVAGRDIMVRVKVVADNSPRPTGPAKGPAARPKEMRTASADAEEGESKSPSRPTMNSPQPKSAEPAQPRSVASEIIESRVGGSLINEAYRLFEGPGSRLLGT